MKVFRLNRLRESKGRDITIYVDKESGSSEGWKCRFIPCFEGKSDKSFSISSVQLLCHGETTMCLLAKLLFHGSYINRTEALFFNHEPVPLVILVIKTTRLNFDNSFRLKIERCCRFIVLIRVSLRSHAIYGAVN